MSSNEKTSESVREKKNVLILMPFQSEELNGAKISHLKKIRIQYIVENLIDIKSRSYPETSIKYTANIVNTGVGEIESVVEQEFEKTDLFIALLSESNVNVIFEVAILNVLQQNLILLKDSGIKGNKIPVYLKGHAVIEFYGGEGEDDEEIEKFITKNSADPNYKINGSNTRSKEIEKELIELIKKEDERLTNSLEVNISKYEQGEVEPPLSFRKLVKDIHPKNSLSSWNTLLPVSVLKANWKPVKEESDEYDGIDSLLNPAPHAATCNNLFIRLFGSAQNNPRHFIEERQPFTAENQMEILSRFISEKNYKAFLKDQGRVFIEVFIKDRPAIAKIPLTFSGGKEEHPYEEFRGKTYMPILIGKKVVGVKSSPHTTYYFIAYVEDFFPYDENKSLELTK